MGCPKASNGHPLFFILALAWVSCFEGIRCIAHHSNQIRISARNRAHGFLLYSGHMNSKFPRTQKSCQAQNPNQRIKKPTPPQVTGSHGLVTGGSFNSVLGRFSRSRFGHAPALLYFFGRSCKLPLRGTFFDPHRIWSAPQQVTIASHEPRYPSTAFAAMVV